MMCIPFICMFVGLPSWVCCMWIGCMLVETRSFLFSFGLSFPTCSLGGNVSISVRRLWGSVQAAAEF